MPALGRYAPEQQRQGLALATARIRLLARKEDERAKIAKEAARPITDPVRWVAERLREHVWSKQGEILRSVRDNRRTAVPSCHGAGKSFIAARAAAWWLESHAPGAAFVVTTAPTFPQVRAILWREINRAHRKGKLRGNVNQTEWWIDGEIVAFGRKPSDYSPDAFQGIHASAVLVVIDEACGVPKNLFDAADTLVTNEASRILAIGNPDDPSSEFASVCKPASGWNVIRIRAADTPNLSGETVPDELHDLLISRLWVEEKAISWGIGSSLYMSKVDGEFPENAEDIVIPLSFIRACQREDRPAGTDEPVELGVDVGGGGDETIIYERRGNRSGQRWSDHGIDSEVVVDKVMVALTASKATRVKVDTIGIGWGVAGSLERRVLGMVPKVAVVRVNVGESSTDPTRFPKLRDEIWWTARELIQAGSWDLRGLSEDTVAQLSAPKYSIDASGRVKIEPKDETRRRLGRSPDDADGFLLSMMEPRRPGLSDYFRSEAERLRILREKTKG